MTIGERIKARRLEKHWSQRDLAYRMGYSHHSTLARIETGKVDVSQSKLAQFAEVLGTTVPDLMGWEEPKKEKPVEDDGLSENTKKLMEFVRSVPEDKAELILRVMRSILEDD